MLLRREEPWTGRPISPDATASRSCTTAGFTRLWNDHQLALGLGCGGRDGVRLVERRRQRLLGQHVLIGRQGGKDDRRMGEIGRRDRDDVEPVMRDEILESSIGGLRAGLRPHLFRAIHGDVADRDDLGLRQDAEDMRVIGAPEAGADNSDLELLHVLQAPFQIIP